MELNLFEVEQGNGKGLAIDRNTDSVLRTMGLSSCIAVLIVGSNQCVMIHSDSNLAAGKGRLSLVNAIRSLGLNRHEHFDIGLIGSLVVDSLNMKYEEVCKVLPNTRLKMLSSNEDSAYLTSDGVMAVSRRALAEQLHIEPDDLVFTLPRSGLSL